MGFWSEFSQDEKSHHSPIEYFDLQLRTEALCMLMLTWGCRCRKSHQNIGIVLTQVIRKGKLKARTLSCPDLSVALFIIINLIEYFFKESIEQVNILPIRNLVRHENCTLFKINKIAKLIQKIGTSLASANLFLQQIFQLIKYIFTLI